LNCSPCPFSAALFPVEMFFLFSVVEAISEVSPPPVFPSFFFFFFVRVWSCLPHYPKIPFFFLNFFVLYPCSLKNDARVWSSLPFGKPPEKERKREREKAKGQKAGKRSIFLLFFGQFRTMCVE
jgi:hypothetical protein